MLSISILCATQLTLLALVCRYGELHPSFPTEGKYAATLDEKQVDTYLTLWGEDDKVPKYQFRYDANKGNSNLKYHLSRYHNTYWQAVLEAEDGGNPAATGRKRSGDGSNPKAGEVALGAFFRSVKKVKKDSPKAVAFAELLTLLIVHARLPFNIVTQPIFKAFVWFLDPSVPMPTRNEITGSLLPRMVGVCKDNLRDSLKGVLGAAVTFDLWMSKKTDDILSVDLHYIDERWMWRHVHLGLVAMNGNTKGVVVATKLKEIFDDYNLMGRLYAMVFDGGANLSTARNELQRLHGTGFCCNALERKNLCITNCLAHLINNSCNGAVLAAKAASYKVCSMHCVFCINCLDYLC